MLENQPDKKFSALKEILQNNKIHDSVDKQNELIKYCFNPSITLSKLRSELQKDKASYKLSNF